MVLAIVFGGAVGPVLLVSGLERVAASPKGSQDGKPESPFAVLAKIKEKS